jgi:FtsP/CotA-like multicopper oxidase with cupredoxin domain
MLQEQSGVYGSIVIDPKEPSAAFNYDHEEVLVVSDWTFQKPRNVLRNLKRGNEWYNVKKGTATPLNQVIARGALGAQLDFWRQRMEGADIADIYYPAFLTNGDTVQYYTKYKPGEKVRLRIINAAASSQFWLTFGGTPPLLVSADGLDVVPVDKEKLFIAIAETYDVIITIPEDGQIEMRAVAQDGSGATYAYFGSGKILPAEVLPRPDKIGMMMQMADMNMRMGAPAMKFNPSKEEPYELMRNWGMDMDMGHNKEMKGNNDGQDERRRCLIRGKRNCRKRTADIGIGYATNGNVCRIQLRFFKGPCSYYH